MLEKGLNPITKSALTLDNKGELYPLVAFLQTIGVKRYYLMHEDIMGRPEAKTFSFPDFWEIYMGIRNIFRGSIDVGYVAASGFRTDPAGLDRRCNAGSKKLAIFPDGSVFPCNLFGGFPEFNLGNIFHTNIEKISTHHMLGYFRERSQGNKCPHHRCQFYSECRGGCPAHMYQYSGIHDSVDPRCMHIDKTL